MPQNYSNRMFLTGEHVGNNKKLVPEQHASTTMTLDPYENHRFLKQMADKYTFLLNY